MSLIDSTYFRNEISIPVGTYSDLQQFIDRYEKEVLIGLLGYTLYTEMMAAYAASIATVPVPLPEKWDKLINGSIYNCCGFELRWNGLINSDKVSFISYYVFCEYVRAKQSAVQGTGTVQAKNENSFVVDGIGKHTNSWNEFVHEYYNCTEFLSANTELYDLTTVNQYLYSYTNIFGI